MTLKQRIRTGTYASFERRYEPIPLEDGDIQREWTDPAVQAADAAFVWTIVDCDGKLILVPGFASVNYFSRVLCRNPWGRDEELNTGYRY